MLGLLLAMRISFTFFARVRQVLLFAVENAIAVVATHMFRAYCCHVFIT